MEETIISEQANPLEIFLGGPKKNLDYRKRFDAAVRAVFKSADVHIDRMKPGEFETFMERVGAIFMKRLGKMQVEDTVYEDVKEGTGIKKLGTLASEIDLWTAGDVINNHQQNMVKQSTVTDLLDRHLGDAPVDRNHIISDEKWEAVPGAIEDFLLKRNINEVMVVVFDDTEGSMERVQREIKTYVDSAEHTVKVHTVLVRAKRGKKADEEWTFRCAGEAKDTVELAQIVEAGIKGTNLSAGNVIVFLDFDGTLSDNAVTGERREKVFLKTMKETLRAGIKAFCEEYIPVVDREEINNILQERIAAVIDATLNEDETDNKSVAETQPSIARQIDISHFSLRNAIMDGEKFREVNEAVERIFEVYGAQVADPAPAFNISEEMQILKGALVSGSYEDQGDISRLQYAIAAGYCVLKEYEKAYDLLQKTLLEGNLIPAVLLDCCLHLGEYETVILNYDIHKTWWRKMLSIREKTDLFSFFGKAVEDLGGSDEDTQLAECLMESMEEIEADIMQDYDNAPDTAENRDSAEASKILLTYHKMFAESRLLQRKIRDPNMTREVKEEEIERFQTKYTQFLAAFDELIEKQKDVETRHALANNRMGVQTLLASVMLCSERKEKKEEAYQRAVASVNFSQGEGMDYIYDSQKGGALEFLEMAERELGVCDQERYGGVYPSVLFPPETHSRHAESCNKRGDIYGSLRAFSYGFAAEFLRQLTEYDTTSQSPVLLNKVVMLFPITAIGANDTIETVMERAEPLKVLGKDKFLLGLALDKYLFFYGSVHEKAGQALKQIAPEKALINCRIKSPESLFLKMLKEKKERVTAITDTIGFSIHTDTEEEAAEMYQKVKNQMRPDHPLKEFNTWVNPTEYNYRSMDITGYYEPAGAVINVQILTKDMERSMSGNTAGHQQYKKRSGKMLIREMQESPREYLELTERIILNLVGAYKEFE